MQPDAAVKSSISRPRKPTPPTPTERMVDALCIWRVDLDDADQVRGVLRLSGFTSVQIDALADMAVAAARKRRPRGR